MTILVVMPLVLAASIKMQIYRVGGYVRDKLLGLIPNDCDYVVVGSSREQMLALGYQQVGKFFPVFLHPQTGEEYALARAEAKYGTGHTGFQVDSSKLISLEQDLLRRDLTINAIAEDKDGQLIDPYDGQIDLQNKLLRHISAAFNDDPLRVLRVARFAAKLNFSVAPETLNLMQQMAQTEEGLTISRERVLQELSKALECEHSEQFFMVLRETYNLQIFFPNLALKLSSEIIFSKFCQELKSMMDQLQRYQLIALYLDNGTPDNNLPEITYDKRLLKMLHQTQLIQRFCNNHMLSPQEELGLYKQLDIWRNYTQFTLLANNYALYLTANQSGQILARLNKIQQLAQKLKDAPLNELIAKFKLQPVQLAKAIQNYYLDLISSHYKDKQ